MRLIYVFAYTKHTAQPADGMPASHIRPWKTDRIRQTIESCVYCRLSTASSIIANLSKKSIIRLNIGTYISIWRGLRRHGNEFTSLNVFCTFSVWFSKQFCVGRKVFLFFHLSPLPTTSATDFKGKPMVVSNMLNITEILTKNRYNR